MPRKPTISPSKVTTYLACPVKYKWTYVDERGKWYLRSHHYYSFGTSLHKALQRFYDSSDSGVETVEQAVAALEESWIEAGYRSPQEMEEALGLGKQLVATVVEQELAAPSEAKVLFVEKRLRKDEGEYVLLGVLDRVDEYPDGSLEIVDYKSGRSKVSDDEVRADLAMGFYQLLLRSQFPDRAVRATIIALRTGAKGTAQLSQEELDQFEADLNQLAKEILNRDFENLVPVWKPLCTTCDFLPLCRKHPDFEEPSEVDAGTQ